MPTFQGRAATFADRVARRDFHLRQTSLTHNADQVGDSKLKHILDEAVDDTSNTFTENDAISVEQADAVIAGKAPDGTDAYLLLEASITIAKDDVDRAKDRAELLQLATGATTHAVVIGEAITGEAATQAKDRTVKGVDKTCHCGGVTVYHRSDHSQQQIGRSGDVTGVGRGSIDGALCVVRFF